MRHRFSSLRRAVLLSLPVCAWAVSAASAETALKGVWAGRSFEARKGSNGPLAPLPQVNIYLWKAALDVLRKLPLEQADPFSGLIVSGWFSVDGYPDDRFKVQAAVTTKRLTVDGLSVQVFHEQKDGQDWRAAFDEKTLGREIFNRILYQARWRYAQRDVKIID